MIHADSLSKRFRTTHGAVTALDGVSLELYPGDRLGLMGHSGSGKSTLAKIVAMLLRPDAGTLTIDGIGVERWGVAAPRELRRKVQLLWQAPRLAVDPRLRLRDIILEPLAANGLLPQDAQERQALLLQWSFKAGLTRELLSRFPHEVSDGQLQRACLARALILEPQYLICDEMSAMLDVSTQASLLQVIAEQQESGTQMGVLLISHDPILVKHWCNRLIQLEGGRIPSNEAGLPEGRSLQPALSAEGS
jgi:ABC-type dipeptide/oligopeptide/nickel transport system ATPase subunit